MILSNQSVVFPISLWRENYILEKAHFLNILSIDRLSSFSFSDCRLSYCFYLWHGNDQFCQSLLVDEQTYRDDGKSGSWWHGEASSTRSCSITVSGLAVRVIVVGSVEVFGDMHVLTQSSPLSKRQ